MTRTFDTAVTRGTPRENPRRKYQRRNGMLRALGYSNYGAYLASPHWTRTRAAYRASDLPQDCICGDDETQLHHLTYERVGQEHLSDLVPLCHRCHSLVHVLDWRGDLGIDLAGLTDAERAQAGRAWLASEIERLAAEKAERLKAEREHVLSLPFAGRLMRAVRTAKTRHVDVSHELHLLAKSSGRTDQQLTKRLRIIEALAYGWEDWDPRTGEGNLTERLRNAA